MEKKHVDNEYVVLDDFMPDSLVNHIEQVMMFNDNLAWGFRDSTAGVDDIDTNNKNIKETFQFQSNLFDHDSGPTSQFFEAIHPIMMFAEYALGFTTQNVSRIKANTLLQVAGTEGKYHPPHMDLMNDNGYAMVYYVHDADGETVLFDKRFKQAFKHDPKYLNHGAYDLNEIARVTPKKGRALLFHSNRFHASSNPQVAQRRVIINHVFTTDDNFLTKIG
tara:strand:+ start:3594 stop:4253 length:660 start_codon:yes stop_codon:yes gene_type:complete